MGSLNVPAAGSVYLDANALIYSVEGHPVFAPLLAPVWQTAAAGNIEVVSSELVLLEVLVRPLRMGNFKLATDYEQLFVSANTRLIPISLPILRDAAALRATIPSL